jgi:hypothetical protein
LEGGQSDAYVIADRDRLIQILVNLTQNACEAAPEGSKIAWTLYDDPRTSSVTLEVRNPGTPIASELLPRLTEPFFSTKPSGTGLGLAIVRRLTLVLGGELSFSSAETRGTCVRVSLPRLAATEGGNE